MDIDYLDSIEHFKIFTKSLKRVDQNIAKLKQVEDVVNKDVYDIFRDGVIHSFQVCFHQFWQALSLAKVADWKLESAKYDWGSLVNIDKWILDAYEKGNEDEKLQEIFSQYLPQLKLFKEEFQKIVE